MPLDKQNISYDFGKGLSEAVDPDLLADGSVLKVKDGVYNQAGRVDKRDGYDVLSRAVLDPGGLKPIRPLMGVTGVHSHNDQLTASESTSILSYNESRELWTASGGFHRACALDKDELVACDYNIIRASHAEANNLRVVVFEGASHVVGYKVVDRESNTTLFITYDVNLQLVGGSYADVVDGGAVGAHQYTDPSIVEKDGKFFIFMVRDRYNLWINASGGNVVPPVREPATVNPGTGVNEYPELIMFGLNLVDYSLTYQPNPAEEERYLIKFDLGDQYNNFTHHNGSVHDPFNDHSYCSYDVKVPKVALGQPSTTDNYFVVVVSACWIARIYTVRTDLSSIVDHHDAEVTGASTAPDGTYYTGKEVNFICVGQSSRTGGPIAGEKTWRAWWWKWENLPDGNVCRYMNFSIDSDGLITQISGGTNVDEFDNKSQPWSDYNPLTDAAFIGFTVTDIYTPTTSLKIYELDSTATLGLVTSPGWSVSNLQIPQRCGVKSNPFVYYKDPSGGTDARKYGMAIAVTPTLDGLATNFIFAEGGQQNVICKYSSGSSSTDEWGRFFNNVALALPYNSYWNLMTGTAPDFNIDAVSPTFMWSSPRPSPLVQQSVENGPYDLTSLTTIERIQAQVEDGEILADGRVREITMDLGDKVSPDFLSFSSDLYMNGGYFAVFDNNVIVENNFHLPPVITSISNEGGTRWKYRAIYEWIDDNGNLHRSEPSAFMATSTDPDSGTGTELDIVAPIITGKVIHHVSIAVYRTEANKDVYFRVTKQLAPVYPVAPADRDESNRHINPNVLGETITLIDELNDTDIIGNEILYTTGSVLSNVPPPSMNTITEHDGRIFGSGLDNPNVIYYSKIKRPNTSIEFSELLTIDVPPEGGQIVGLNSLDGNLIIFKENKVYRMYGEGPADTGANSTYSRPTLISSSHGAKTDKAIINTIYGIVFRGTDGGIYLLDRSLVFKYIGAPVEDSNNLEIVHASNLGLDNEIRFILENGEALVYNYWFDQWSRFTNHTSVGSTVWKDKFVMARVDDSKGIWVQNRNSYLDVTEPIYLDVETAWIKLAGIKGFQRCNWLSLLGEQTDAHDVNVSIFRDYNNDPVESFTVDGSDILGLHPYGDPACGLYGVPACGPYGWPGDDVYQWRHKPHIQKCESIKLSIKDTAELSGVYDASIATNFSLKNLTLYIGVKKGQFKLPERKTV